MPWSRSRFYSSASVLLTFSGGACPSQPPAESPVQSTSQRPPFVEYTGPQLGPTSVHRDAVPDALLKDVLADAARRADVSPSKIEIVSTQKVTWNDGSLGCQRRDGMVTQALVPGYRIWVRGPDGTHDYHAAHSGAFVLCPPSRAPAREGCR